MRPGGIIFWDWNGTLMDDVDFCIRCLNELLALHGYVQQYTPEEYRAIFGFPIEEYYRRAGFDFARHPYPVLAERYMELYNAGVAACPAAPHAAQALGALQSRGFRQAILSACREDYLIEQVSARGLAGYFTELLGQQDIYGAGKIERGRAWLRASGLAPADCVMVGDTDHDAAVAAALGTRCVLYAGGHQARSHLETVCPCVIDSLDALPAAVERL